MFDLIVIFVCAFYLGCVFTIFAIRKTSIPANSARYRFMRSRMTHRPPEQIDAIIDKHIAIQKAERDKK